MIITKVTYADLLKYEPPIVRRGDPSNTYVDEYEDFITKAKDVLTSDIKSMGYKLRLLCTPLTLSTSKSIKDEIERTRLIVDVSANSGEVTLTLSGTNDESNETWDEVGSIVCGTDAEDDVEATGSLGEQTTTFEKIYKYYKLESTPTTTGTITYTAYLVERSFELPLIYLSLYLIFASKSKIANDDYYNKTEQYKTLYENILKSNFFSYDSNEDGEADEDEYSYQTVRVRR